MLTTNKKKNAVSLKWIKFLSKFFQWKRRLSDTRGLSNNLLKNTQLKFKIYVERQQINERNRFSKANRYFFSDFQQ